MEKIQHPQLSQDTPTNSVVGGQELGEEMKVWREIAASESRMMLMKSMIHEQLAFADLEEFGKEFENKLKSMNIKNKTLYNRVSQPAMKAKLTDEQMWRRDLMRMKLKMKKDLSEELGIRSRKYKKTMNYLNQTAKEHKKSLNEKYKNKINHLREKYKNKKNEDLSTIPPVDLVKFEDLSVFNKNLFEAIEVTKPEVITVGEIELSDDEKMVLSLHNKFSVLENLKPGDIDADIEASIAKLRMEKKKEKDYEDYTPEERAEDEELGAKNRMVFNPSEKTFDCRKRRVTDLKECARITLPGPLSPDEESKIEVRKRTHKEIFNKYRIKHTNKKGEQKSNLTKNEQAGLKSLLKRIKNEEIMVVKTDKSGKFIVTTPEKYIEMGKEHTDKDIEVGWEQVRSMERVVNQHTIAWELMWRTGEDHSHQDRVIRSKATRSGNQANLSLLYKDHKSGNKTRPVASGNESYNLGLSNGISEVMEAVARTKKTPYAVISSEDMLARVHQHNKNIVNKDKVKENKTADVQEDEARPENENIESSKTSVEEQLSLIGSDVIALFPSIKADNTARIVREAVESSKVKFEGFDYDKARAYIAINEGDLDDDLKQKLQHLIPKRKAKTGTKPSMSSIVKNWNPHDQWDILGEVDEAEEKLVIGTVTEIALKVLFKNFSYKFGGKYYHQQAGGPIGVRATGAASELVMEHWASLYREILEISGVTIHVLAGYVDDGRQVTSLLPLGWSFQEDSKKFEYSDEALEEDNKKKATGESQNQRMARRCQPAMNSINMDLQFTTESQEDFENERLPTLDFEMWISSDNKIRHSFYQKPMKTPFVLMERSGTSYQQKFQILTNELTRRLSNIMVEEILQSEINQKIEQFITELKNSEYSLEQAREIVCCGIRGWEAKKRKRKRENSDFYRLAENTLEGRVRKNLFERENWYKENEDGEKDEESPVKKRKLNINTRTWKRGTRRLHRVGQKKEIKSVIFVPHTRGSELAKNLREKEEKLQDVTGDRVKIVEKAGRKLENILASGDPWKGMDCKRPNCFLCNSKILTGKGLRQDCSKRNILYEIKCITCEEIEMEKNRVINRR